MGFFDKVKAFAGGKGMAHVEVTQAAGAPPGSARFGIDMTTLTGTMRVTADKPCTLLATKAELVLRTEMEGQWSDVTVASGKVAEVQELAAGQVIDATWSIAGIDLGEYLRNQSFDDVNSAVGNPRVKVLVNCIADVKGSPFDPNAEAEVQLAPSTMSPVAVAITVVEGQPATQASFPVTDTVLKGTVEVTGKSRCTLLATYYEICLQLAGQDELIVVAKDQHPEIKKSGLAGLSVSFGGTNIEFPKELDHGDKATQTWMVNDIDLPGALAARGISDAQAAVREGKARLFVRSRADVANLPGVGEVLQPVRMV